MHCGRFIPRPISRRAMLARCANGFGSLALTALLAEEGRGAPAAGNPADRNPFAPRPTHFPARARNVIFLYMDGGPSQVDTFDYKPMLEKYHGRDPHSVFKVEPTQFNNVGKVMATPWKFQQRGKSGLWVSELFPHVAQCVDDLCVIRSMVSKFPEHTSANYFLHTGSGIQGRPSMGAWAGYGLGSENRDLPGFIVLNGGLIPPGGLDNFNSGFLPAAYQASVFRPSDPPVANIKRVEPTDRHQRNKLEALRRLDQQELDRIGSTDEIESAIANYETAYRMQSAVPELIDLHGEGPATKRMYGLDSSYDGTRIFAAQCLMARRLVERGARFVELTCPAVGTDRWDQHGGLKEGHERNCRAVDQPIAALLHDLKARGLLETTLVVWAGEFGRTPFAQGSDGRDHDPFGFTIWLAGGGVKGGIAYGQTDEWGYKAVVDKVEMHDLHATMLHLLGMDHKRLTFRFGGRDMRLTDVHGEVVEAILA
ncbi:MAG: DUF1501 domain-containing protein [Isosphaeraceae bacterium]|nr:DUF1501 domain-containing protein [Isosphaeraceae bacterium]